MKRNFTNQANILKLFYTILFTLFTFFLQAGTITINSVTTVNATCSNNASITVNATEAVPVPSLFYSLTGSTTLTNTNGVFNSLEAGTYYLKVFNLSNDSAIQSNIIITTSYAAPVIQRIDTIAPYCDNDVTGVLTGVLQTGTGLGPFLWRLDTITGATIRPFQASATFTNLPIGNYRMTLQDCANTVNYAIEFLPNGSEFSDGLYGNGFPTVEMIDCDSVMYRVIINHLNKKLKPPYTLRITTASGTQFIANNDITLVYSNTDYLYFSQKISGVTYGDQIDVAVFNACNDSIKTTGRILNFNKFIATPSLLCNDSLSVNFTLYDPSPDRYQTGLQAPVQFQVIDSTTGTVLLDSVRTRTQAQILLEQYGFESVYYINLKPIENNKTYIFIVKDGCGKTYRDTFRFYVQPARPYFNVGDVGYICADSVALFKVMFVYNFKSLPTFEVLSGPSTVSSTQPLYAYNDTYTYPQSMFIYDVGNNLYNTGLSGLTAGTYSLRFTDNCGTQLDTTLVIQPSEIKRLAHRLTYTKGCGNNNTLHFAADYGFIPDLRISRLGFGTVYYNSFSAFTAPNQISLNNQPAGTYVVEFEYNGNYFGYALNDNKTCKRIYDTIIIPAQTSPRITAHNVVKCNNNIVLELIPDTTVGVPNYKYQLQDKNGAYTALQSSNAFNVADTGNYKAIIIDSCGAQFIYNVFVDTISFQSVFLSGRNCVGDSVRLSLLSSPFVHYKWTTPSNVVFTGNSIAINPVTLADQGNYTIERYIEIAGCRDTVTQSYNLNVSSCLLPVELVYFNVECENNQTGFSWQTASESNNKYFEIEKSEDAMHFVAAERIYPKNGNANYVQNYSAALNTDEMFSYFRLKQVDENGKISFSKIQTKKCGIAASSVRIYPNPASDFLTIDFNGISGEKTILVYDVIGQQIMNVKETAAIIHLNINDLPRSMYLIKILADDVLYKSVKIIKEQQVANIKK
ncbi:MAG: T9SS type A sorting domain-containing protein [Chitinophagales bacterium]|nr:T9SS type A sorting domain-containing protein [Chitinophagales bacterium]